MKTCDVKGCLNPVFGTDKNTKKRYCKNHQHLRTDTLKSLRRGTVQKRNEKLSRNKLDFDVFQWGFDNEATMFDSIWEERDHHSEISGKNLENVMLYHAMFAHILPKGKYPLYRYNPENIMLVLPLEHVLLDQGTSSARRNYEKKSPSADFSEFYRRKEELLKSYPKHGIYQQSERNDA